jgi:uncharacterized phage protein gp47/JayE
MAGLIPAPDLDIRNEEALAAQAIARVSGGLTVARIDSQIEQLRRLRVMVLAGLTTPACTELTNANPSSPHTVLLEAQAWLVAQIARRINILPRAVQIAFARLFNITLREATAANTTLTFTAGAPVLAPLLIPAGTVVSTEDGPYTFSTNEDAFIPTGESEIAVAAHSMATGALFLVENSLVRMVDPLAGISTVTNPDLVDSGADAETVDEALERARHYQRRGERLVSSQDFEQAVLEDVLQGNGIVRAFPFLVPGNFNNFRVGHTTLVVMTKAGNALADDVKARIATLLEQAVGNQFVYLLDPQYAAFSIIADVKLTGLTSQVAILAGVEANLRAFYAAKPGNFGRPVSRAEIIAIIEGSTGVERIVSAPDGPILTSPLADITLAPYEMPRLVNVVLNAV